MRALAVLVLLLGLAVPAFAGAPPAPASLRIGLLKYGTVSWEVATIEAQGLDKKYGLVLDVRGFASSHAAAIALQAGQVDLIVSDWLWVLEQRNQQRHYAYYPYSTAIGGMRLAAGVKITGLAQLQGLRLGIAGGAQDKSWRIFQAFARQQLGLDLAASNDIKYASPPLLNQLLLRGQLDAVINYWHFNARLSARGMTTLAETQDLLQVLVGSDRVPMLGWVFERDWAQAHADFLKRFLAASAEAKALLARADAPWQALDGQLKADSETERHALMAAYRRGIPAAFTPADAATIARVYALLTAQNGAAPGPGQVMPVAMSPKIDPEIFWWPDTGARQHD